MSKPSVYLAGPIAGLTLEEAQTWRTEAVWWLKRRGIHGIDPLAGAEKTLKGDEVQTKQAPERDPFTSARGILCQDFYYCTHASMVLVNVLGATKVSIGSVMEGAWAYQIRTPLVIACDNDVHDQTMFHTSADYWVDDIDVALDICVKVLSQ